MSSGHLRRFLFHVVFLYANLLSLSICAKKDTKEAFHLLQPSFALRPSYTTLQKLVEDNQPV